MYWNDPDIIGLTINLIANFLTKLRWKVAQFRCPSSESQGWKIISQTSQLSLSSLINYLQITPRCSFKNTQRIPTNQIADIKEEHSPTTKRGFNQPSNLNFVFAASPHLYRPRRSWSIAVLEFWGSFDVNFVCNRIWINVGNLSDSIQRRPLEFKKFWSGKTLDFLCSTEATQHHIP